MYTRARRGSAAAFTTFVLAALALVTPVGAEDAPGDAIVGTWLTEKEDARVEVVREGDTYAGRVVWLAEPDYPAEDAEAGKPKRDRENPDPARRAQPVLGLRIMQGFTHAGGNRWQNGTFYDPEVGKTYKGKVTLRDPDTLDLRGFVGVSLIGRTSTWTRWRPPADDPADAAE